ncbi:acetolactate synthase small subunit [Prolixibacter denitrificans]|nr:acetolactate synthase small subunit [Prolixibacter denitrificans]PSK83999.1 acetolactate synthase small subunit [Prolixibacter denitrificans]
MKEEFIISAYSENHIGLLNRITIIFTRRKVNIESLTVSESALSGISKFTIVVREERSRVENIVKQIEKQVDVLKAYFHTNEEMIFQEIALYKVPTQALMESDQIERMVRKHNARILEITKDYTVIEKTGHKEETQELFEGLNKFGVLQFIRSGRVAITRSANERLSEFLAERDALLASIEMKSN